MKYRTTDHIEPSGRRDVDYHCSSQRANSRVTSTPNAPNVNNAVAKPNAAGATIEVPSHLGLSLVVTILSVVGGTLLYLLLPARSSLRSGHQATCSVRTMYCGVVVQSVRLHGLFIGALLR